MNTRRWVRGVRAGAIRRRLVVAGVVAVDRMLFDRERTAMVSRLDQASRRLHGALVELERDAAEP